jgi:hypothetical protein
MPNPCDNMNHRRVDAPVAHCPQCGGVVNQALRATQCAEADHAAARRRQLEFCVNCGRPLIVAR